MYGSTSKIASIAGLFAASLLLVSIGCAPNPADEVTKAEVGETAGAAKKSAGVALAAQPGAQSVKYTVAGGSKIGFVGSKVTGSHEGGFKNIAGEFTVAGDQLVGNDGSIVIDMNSLWTDNDRLTGHLKSSDFFDVARYPTASFEFTKLARTKGSAYTVPGALTLHGVTKQISFPATLEIMGEQAQLAAEFAIDRFDFDVRYPGKPDDLIRQEVVIKLNINIVKALG
jgi:polyisoprenoid-binding protein YceI